ncbi:hypothetical protein ACRRTK_003385 [Alexandromys fortis]
MYTEGILDLTEIMLKVVKCPPYKREAKISLVKDKTKNWYWSVYEKVLKSHGQDYLVGNRLTRVDIHLLEVLLYVEELDSSLLAPFPLLKALKSRISSLPNVKKFLQPGSQRKPLINAKQIEEARKIFKFYMEQQHLDIFTSAKGPDEQLCPSILQPWDNGLSHLVSGWSHGRAGMKETGGLQHELIPFYEKTYRVLIKVKPEPDGMLLYLYGLREERDFTLVLILSLACKLRMKRNREDMLGHDFNMETGALLWKRLRLETGMPSSISVCAMTGLQHELIPFFENTYNVLINVKPDQDGMLLYLYGLREERDFTLVLILSLACKLHIKRNRGLDYELIPLFQDTYWILITFKSKERFMAVYLYGMSIERMVVAFLIVSLACKLRMKRNREDMLGHDFNMETGALLWKGLRLETGMPSSISVCATTAWSSSILRSLPVPRSPIYPPFPSSMLRPKVFPEISWTRMGFCFPQDILNIDDVHKLFPNFSDYMDFPPIHLEKWVFRGLFGLHHELIPLFEVTYCVSIIVQPDPDGMLLYLHGLTTERAVTLVLIMSLACNLRMKRNRGK